MKAAEGWLELGNPREAEAELEQIELPFRSHPDVLELRWQLCARLKNWNGALEAGSALIQVAPGEAQGWVHRSYALHELKRTVEARENLLRVASRFPNDATLLYNLACYESQLGRLEQAKLWLGKALQAGDPIAVKRMALQDADLEPLWPHIETF